MNKAHFLELILCVLLVFSVSGVEGQEVVVFSTARYAGKSQPLRGLKIVKAKVESHEINKVEVVNLENALQKSDTAKNQSIDRLLQSKMGNHRLGAILQNFEGVGNLQNKLPPDSQGDVGIGHYIQMINMSFAIFDKSGNLLYGPASNLSLWQNAPEPWSSCSNGDPIVLYDEQADRWLLSELSFPDYPNGPYYIKIAISATGDPLGPWFLYGFEYEYFCDYPKFSIWNDGYYLTTNNNEWINNQWDFHAVGLSVFERDSMLTGSRNARRIFYDFFPNQQPWSVLPADFDGQPPPPDTPAYLAYLDDGTTDKIVIYKSVTDWQNINNNSVTLLKTLFPEPFNPNLPDGISQPENAPYLAPLSNRLMYRLQYRHFPDYDCLVTNHSVNRGGNIAGIRWYELRNDENDWHIYQQGTWSPDETHRWMGSAAMDGYGNMAVGYSAADEHVYPSVRYAGRTSNAQPGIFDLEEVEIVRGSGVQTNPNHRWGDYSAMSVDPADQTTFWYTQQYYETTGDRCWQTRIAAFHIQDFLAVTVETQQDTLCEGDSTQLFANAYGGSGVYTFSWSSNPPGFQSTQRNPVVAPSCNTTYYCLTDDHVNKIQDSAKVVVTLAPVAFAGNDSIICNNQVFEITGSYAAHFSGLMWATSGDGSFDQPQILQPVYTPGNADILDGSVLLTLTAIPLSGCPEASDSLVLTLDPCNIINKITLDDESVIIYPNPGRDEFMVRFTEIVPAEFELNIYTLYGKMLFATSFGNADRKINFKIKIPGLKQGVYLMEIRTENSRFFKRVILGK